MSTRGTILYHEDDKKGITTHIYEELASCERQDIRLEINFVHDTMINVPWPKGLTQEQVLKLSITPTERTEPDFNDIFALEGSLGGLPLEGTLAEERANDQKREDEGYGFPTSPAES